MCIRDRTYIASEVDGKVDMKFRSTLCNHCANPACVAACPTGAMHKSEETGIVSVDQDKMCIRDRLHSLHEDLERLVRVRTEQLADANTTLTNRCV